MARIETDPQKICAKLIDDVVITPVYDRKTHVTTFTYQFPGWLNANYTPETVRMLIDIITPIIETEMNASTNKECFQVIKENV